MQDVTKPTSGNQTGEAHPSATRTLVLVFRIVRWTVYACVLIVLILLLHKAPPPAVSATPEAAARVEQKFQDVQQSVSQGQPATLRMNETELNSYLASHLDLAERKASSGAATAAPEDAPTATPNAEQPSADDVEQMRSNVRDVKVQLVYDRVRAYVVFNVHGKDMTLQLEGKLGADNGFLRFEPVSGQIGALPIPQATLEAAVRKMMESPENREKLKLPSDISDLKIENGEVVAKYQ
jgi:pyruvate/2-oxoglutarate dehydrogenase complex dihydrolipoamide acyltransferase (E2) component